ncbi:MAG: hypothetical protein H0X30_14080 [Anaerolineae bacterium]|nr:hypothetical protein [Anaerolineae bacterium]
MVDEEKLKEFRRSDLNILRTLGGKDIEECVTSPEESIRVLSVLIPLLQAHLALAESFTEGEKERIKNFGYHHVDSSFSSEGWE